MLVFMDNFGWGEPGFNGGGPIIADASPENLAKAEAFAKQIKVHPLDKAGDPPQNRYVDIYGQLMEGTPVLDGTIYRELNDIIKKRSSRSRTSP